MSNESRDGWEEQVRSVASAFPYPATPDLAGAVQRRLAAETMRARPRRRLVPVAAVLAILLIVAAGLLAVPQVRAAVLEALNIGAIRIWLGEATPAAGTPEVQPTAVTPSSLLDLAGEMSLAQARAEVDFQVRLPTYPPDLGPPDRVFVQQWDGPAVILVWLDPDQPSRVRLSLHLLGPSTIAEKFEPLTVVETSVHGRPAMWTEGPYLLQLQDGQAVVRRLVDGHVLIWTEGAITYRLETDVDMEEAIRIAESVE